MTSRSPARWLAPVALVGAAVAILAVVQSSGSGGGTSSRTTAPRGATGSSSSAATPVTTTAATVPRSYTVAPGDVLSSIAERTGVPLARIQALNPSVDAQSLHAGQKLKLAP